MTRPLTTLLLAAGIIVGTASSVHTRSPVDRRPTIECPAGARPDASSVSSSPTTAPGRLRSAGEEMYVGVRGLEQDTVLGPVRLTRMSLVKVTQEPRFRPGSSVVLNATVTADLRPQRLTKVHVPAGHYQVVSSNYGNLWLETCAAGKLSDVHVAQRASLTLRSSAVAQGGRSDPPARLRRGRAPTEAVRCRGRAPRGDPGPGRRGRR